MKTEQLPCKDCITLAICKTRAIYLRQTFGKDAVTDGSLISHLTQKCDLIYAYTYDEFRPPVGRYLKQSECKEAADFLTERI
jgi:hypothetical protein